MAADSLTVILTHEHTDFDALASLLAAHKLYPYATPVLPRSLNRNLRDFLVLYRSALPFRQQEEMPRRRIDSVIVVDAQTFSSIRGMRADTPGQIIDHHPLQRSLEPGWSYWGGETGATTTLLVEKVAERQIPLTPVEATLLLLGIYEDTGSLIYATTTPRDLRTAAWLLERGANLQVVHRFLHHSLTAAQLELYDQLVEHSQIHEVAGHSIVVASAVAPEYSDEISTLAHKLRDVYDPSALFLLVDLGDRVQMVARGASDAIDVGSVALQMGGGGHARAAAALIRGRSLPEIQAHLLHLLRASVKPSMTVAQIMTHGYPMAVTPATTIGDMVGIIHRYGFEGYPVIDSGETTDSGRIIGHIAQLRGIITRRQVDRAQQHGLIAHTVDRYMRTGQVWVSPQQSIAELQQAMIESGWGQIPVADPESKLIVGIVTRTDLIKLWGEPLQPAQREDIALRLEAALPDSLLGLLRMAGGAAEELKQPLYAVGGFARDLLLDRPNFDVDLVVEGDAIKLARHLARQHGGRVRSHRRFGTAKWVLPPVSGASLPAEANLSGNGASGTQQRMSLPTALDFVTARIEFYDQPTALPTVEHGSIKLDLHRRDFTINTLAICLNPQRWGQLLDFYGGERDLQEGLIRVLHTHSFVDDPTRILRAVRFEQRFGFRIEQRTAELIADSIDLLSRISPARVRHELELILAEDRPEQALRRLDELGVTAYIHPDLRSDEWVAARFVALRAALQAGLLDLAADMDQLYFAIWTFRMDRSQIPALDKRLHLMRSTVTLLEDLHDLKGRSDALQQPDLPRSQVYHILHPALEASRFLLRIISDSPAVRRHIDLYEQELRHVRPHVDGRDLKRMGLAPGPLYREILDMVRNAWLDGAVASVLEERDLVADLVRERLAGAA